MTVPCLPQTDAHARGHVVIAMHACGSVFRVWPKGSFVLRDATCTCIEVCVAPSSVWEYHYPTLRGTRMFSIASNYLTHTKQDTHKGPLLVKCCVQPAARTMSSRREGNGSTKVVLFSLISAPASTDNRTQGNCNIVLVLHLHSLKLRVYT